MKRLIIYGHTNKIGRRKREKEPKNFKKIKNKK